MRTSEQRKKKTAGNIGCQPFVCERRMPYQLPVAPSVRPAATAGPASLEATAAAEPATIAASMEPAATMRPVTASEPAALESSTTLESSAAVEALISAESIAAMPSPLTTISTPTAESVIAPFPTATVVAAPSAIVAATIVAAPAIVSVTVVAAEPRTRSNKQAIDKVIRTVVPKRRTFVWRIPVVAISAYGSRFDVAWPVVAWRDSNSNSKPDLRMGSSCHSHEKPKHNRIL
jgi:hypothetical protein